MSDVEDVAVGGATSDHDGDDDIDDDVDEMDDVDDDMDDVDDTDEELEASDDDEDDDGNRADEEGNREVAPVAIAVLTHIASCLADDPDAVHVSAAELRGRKVRLSVHVAPNDLGRLIGRRGRVAASIRRVVAAAGARDGLDVEVEFAE